MSVGVNLPVECKRSHNIFVTEEFLNILKKCFNWGQSERLPDNSYYPLYIGENIIEQLRTPDNQIIWGRRGTGKTHLLRAFTQRINDDNAINEIAYYIACNDIKYEAPADMIYTDDFQKMKDYARETFKNFLINLVEQIIDTYEYFLKRKKDNRIDFKKVESDLIKLLEICTTGIPHKVSTSGSNILNRSDNKVSETEVDFKPQIKKPISRILDIFNLNYQHKRVKSSDITYRVEAKIIYEISFIEIRKVFRTLLSSMKINMLYLSIDELCSIDDKKSLSFQPVFLDYLRQTFFGLNKICVKIASIREMTKLNSKNSIANFYGIQSGHDIVEFADLDLMHINDDNLINKFEDIVTSRVTYLSKIDNKQTFVYETDYIIKTMFKNKRYFKILVSLSHGIPRNFLHILQVCLLSVNYDVAHYFLHPYLISEVVMAIYVNDHRSNMPMNKDSLYSMINSYVEDNKEYFFLIPIEQVKRVNVEINNLIYTEIIHSIPSSLTPINIMDYYKAYFVDSGKYLHTLKEYNKTEYESRLETFVLSMPRDIKENHLKYVIDLDKVKTDYLECPNCSSIINKEHPVYQKYKCCYTCGFQIEEQKNCAL